MADAKVKKMTQAFDPATGTLTFAFPETKLAPLAFKLAEFPQNVRDFWTAFGMKTAGRNASIGSADEGTVGTPDQMHARITAKFAQWANGILRMAGSGEERAPASTLLLEAAVIYKRMKAAIAAGQDVDSWIDFEGPSAESLRPEFEGLDDVVTNQPAVDAAKAKALAAGEDVEEAEKKATITQLDVLKASTIFKYALSAAKAEREAAKKVALKAAMQKEAAGA